MRSGHILIAEDDPVLQRLYREYLVRSLARDLQVAVYGTDSPEEARRWLQEEEGVLLLDGSVFRQMGIELGELPGRVILCSGDEDLVEEARRVGLRAFCKGTGGLSALSALLQEVQKAA